ncbi:MAG: RIP metalloprotease RseP [Bacteroidales bacterium]|nr:RIP metalloprotease RseP [Bacteroidales bacterium]
MEILIKTLQFLLSLSILVFVHECGHFVAARLFKTRVEKFYLFFNPWFSLFKFKRGDTEYGVGWLPLGGYVKISGMIDESMDKEQMQQEPQPWEFRSKPAWQRLIIMIGGVSVNLIFAVFIYIFMLFLLGESYLPAKNVKYGIVADSLAVDMGLRTGDKIIKLDGSEVDDFMDITKDIILKDVKTITVERDSSIIDVKVPDGYIGKMLSNQKGKFIGVRYPFIVQGFLDESIAQKAGITDGDHIVGIDTIETWSFDEFRMKISDFAGDSATIWVVRAGQRLGFDLLIPENATLGVYVKPLNELLEFGKHEYSFLQAIPAGFVKTYETTVDYLKQLKLLFRKEVKATESLGGFISIGKIFSSTWDWVHFWSITAFLSIILAVMNLLPIPALDGGHVMFLMYEIITGRKPSDKFLEYAQMVGMILLLALLVFANGNDIIRLFK